ncbi:UNVERIFIED_CONTAM: hypothetical protein Sangu_2999300 [Sesamum angustifolium]|uniref:Uncharacterized protein n=1 Tax=Sesamum angustifolium TaxID=2727405 RepID=A0AAW2KPZ1_9LAMI
MVVIEAPKKPSSPGVEKEAISEVEPEHFPQLPHRSEANADRLLHSEERFPDSLPRALLPRNW